MLNTFSGMLHGVMGRGREKNLKCATHSITLAKLDK